LDAPASAVIGVPGKAERCGSNSTGVLLNSAKKGSPQKTEKIVR